MIKKEYQDSKTNGYHIIPEEDNLHDYMVGYFYSRLMDFYPAIFRNVGYNRKGEIGEVDILTFNGEYQHFYEIKSSDSYKQRRKAKEQYVKYKRAHPGKKIKGILITPERIMRLYVE